MLRVYAIASGNDNVATFRFIVACRGAYEFIGIKADWWRIALDLLAKQRAEGSSRYEEYVRSLEKFLPANPNNATGFSLSDLNEAQKWLLMISVDVFADHMIVTHDTFEEWLQIWRSIIAYLLPGFRAVLDQPDIIDAAQLTDAWDHFRAALS